MRVALEQKQKTKTNERQRVSCPECYRSAELREFLTGEEQETRCPRCGAKEVVYLL